MSESCQNKVEGAFSTVENEIRSILPKGADTLYRILNKMPSVLVWSQEEGSQDDVLDACKEMFTDLSELNPEPKFKENVARARKAMQRAIEKLGGKVPSNPQRLDD